MKGKQTLKDLQYIDIIFIEPKDKNMIRSDDNEKIY